MTHWQFEALGSTVEVSSDVPELDHKLDALLRGYGNALGAPLAQPRYVLREVDADAVLLRNDEVCYRSDDREELLDFFQIDLYRQIVAQVENRWLLHAAVVSKGGGVLVLAGPSDAGKSTLCRALMAEGWQYHSEEIAALGEVGVDALRRPLHLEHPEQVAALSGIPSPVRMHEEPESWIVSPPTRPDDSMAVAPRVAAIVRVQYRPEAPTSLAELGPSAALGQLWDCRMNTGLKVAKLACQIVAKTPCYRLDSKDVPSALGALTSLGLE